MKYPTLHKVVLTTMALVASLALCAQAGQLAPSAKQSQKSGDTPTDCPPWELVADMPLDLYGAAGASDGTYSYHAGGYSFTTGTTLDSLYRYDPVANSWTTLAPMPDANIMASAVYYPTTNVIYVFGGEDAVTGVNSNATRIYNIASNTWSAGANMPDVRSFMGSGYNSANGKIYLVSGYNTGTVDSAQPDTWEYDPVANTFTSRLDFPHPAGGMASGFINGLLYVAGGRDAANLNINLNWAFDPVANTWTARADMPGSNPNVTGSGVALDNLWAFGGGNPFGPATKAAFARERGKGQQGPETTNGTVRYDPAADSWTTVANMHVLRSFPSGTAIANKLIAAGGFDGGFTLASAETLEACLASPTPTPTPSGDALWYNGDFDGVNGLANEIDTSLGAGQFASIYDDFIVPDGPGWDIASVFSNNLADTGITGASWEIRQGIVEGSGGTLIASDITLTPTVTPTGRSGFGFTEFMVEATGLSVHLDPGTYFLNVTPIGDLTGRSFVSTTVGANCVGEPCGNNQNAFWNSNFFGFNWTLTGNQGFPYDFSMGINGPGGGGELALVSAASLGRGGFAIDLPLSGPSGVEDRSTGPNGKLKITMTFNNNIVSVQGAGVSCSGGLKSLIIDGNTVTTNWVNVSHGCNGSDNIVTLTDILDDQGNTLGSASVPVGLLLGDANGDRVVNPADRQYVKGFKGQKIDSTNFRADVSSDGYIGVSDVRLVEKQQGTSLP